jgi:hypothetical protein
VQHDPDIAIQSDEALMKRSIAAILVVTVLWPSLALALDGDKAAYFGGTASVYAAAKDPVEGKLDLTDAQSLVLKPGSKEFSSLSIPWKQIDDLEYGQKAGRRVGAAIATTALLGPIGLVTLFSKKRIVRNTLPIVKTRSGKDITYQDDEAQKSAGR